MLCCRHSHGVLTEASRERNEPPHVTILHRTRAWRLNLRAGGFMDKAPDPNEVPQELLAEIEKNWGRLREVWDEMYPENPVDSKEDDDE